MRISFAVLLVVCLFAPTALAQGPLERLIDGKGPGNLSRMPDDQIEGTIWEYKGKLKSVAGSVKRKAKKEEKKEEKSEAGAKPDSPVKDAEAKVKAETKVEEKEEVRELKGRFRTEGDAIFDVSRRLSLPPINEVKKDVEKFRKGELEEIKLPSRSSPKRIGEYHRLRAGRLKLEFDDKDSLHGMMVIKRKKKTSDVWIGTYYEKEGKKTVRTWTVEVRPIED